MGSGQTDGTSEGATTTPSVAESDAAHELSGRQRELDSWQRWLSSRPLRARCVVLSGEAGVGKTALLDAFVSAAERQDLGVLRMTAAPAEIAIPFAGLHLLLRTALTDVVHRLPDEVEVLGTGLAGRGPTRPFGEVAIALMRVLEHLASERALLVVVDDAQWLDRVTVDALGFAARRLPDFEIGFVLSVRDGADPNAVSLLPETERLRLPPLDDVAAAEMLERVAPGLRQTARSRVLREAAGNPLALLELPRTLVSDGTPLLSQWTPLTARLEAAFGARELVLPQRTRDLLLIAAANDSHDVFETLSAGAELTGADAGGSADDLAPAELAGLVTVKGTEIVFRHPLVRSAIYQGAPLARRQAAHAALGAVLGGVPFRQVWHRSAAATGPDDQLADDLITAASHITEMGDGATALAALQRAAALAQGYSRQMSIRLLAAEQAMDQGRHDIGAALLSEIDSSALDDVELHRINYLTEVSIQGTWSGYERCDAYIRLARQMLAAGDRDRALTCLNSLALRMWWSNPPQNVRLELTETAESLDADPLDIRLLCVQGMATPIERGPQVAAHLDHFRAGTTATSPYTTMGLGIIAAAIGDHPLSLGHLYGASEDFRRQGRTGLLGQTLATAAWSDVHTGRFLRAQVSAEEGMRIAEEVGAALWQGTAQLAAAVASARRGDVAKADALTSAVEEAFVERGAGPMLALVLVARSASALSVGRPGDALDQLLRVFDTGDPAYHQYYGSFVADDLIECASRTGRAAELDDVLNGLRTYLDLTGSPILEAGLRYGEPWLSDDSEKEELFLRNVEALDDWPFLQARTHLAYGMWLRRARRMNEARAALRKAATSLRAIGALALAETARNELRASGEVLAEAEPHGWESLSAHELQIATLVADGLSNREVGERLTLSHRTVSTHLYRIFPKLGVSSRAQLAKALNEVRHPPGS